MHCPTCDARLDAQGRRPKYEKQIPAAKRRYVGLLIHDLCRSASRFMRDAGIPSTVRMRTMGRATDSIDRRYDIIDGKDVDDAIDRLAAHSGQAGMGEENRNAQFNAQSAVRPS